VLNGITDPDAGDGVDGDFYINTASNLIFGPKASGAWGSGVAVVGPQGPEGDTGDERETGPQGFRHQGQEFRSRSKENGRHR
jgi:hypothetical protein